MMVKYIKYRLGYSATLSRCMVVITALLGRTRGSKVAVVAFAVVTVVVVTCLPIHGLSVCRHVAGQSELSRWRGEVLLWCVCVRRDYISGPRSV